ncbi:MAG TPA: hypothetical protein VL738_35310, partial [Dactylosporangium sp.]|nr:hypothetical protein [Dactylosporangium sp.]
MMEGDAWRRTDAGGSADADTATFPAVARRREPEQAPAPRRGTTIKLALIGGLACVLLAPPAALAYTTVRDEVAPAVAGQGLGSGNGRGTGGRANPAADRPGSGASRGPAPTTVEGRIKLALEDQGAALLAGDQDAFLQVVDPSAGLLRDDLTRRFGSLRQLQVKVWQAVMEGKPKAEAGGTATVTVLVKYCFVVTTCDPMSLEAATRWNVSGKAVTLLEFGTAKDLGPRPWEASELRAAVGERV